MAVKPLPGIGFPLVVAFAQYPKNYCSTALFQYDDGQVHKT